MRAYDGGCPATAAGTPRSYHAHCEHDPRGMGPSMAVVGSTTKKAVFEASTPSGSWRPRSGRGRWSSWTTSARIEEIGCARLWWTAGVRALVLAGLLAGVLAHRGGVEQDRALLGKASARTRKALWWRPSAGHSRRLRLGRRGASSVTVVTRSPLNRHEHRCRGKERQP